MLSKQLDMMSPPSVTAVHKQPSKTPTEYVSPLGRRHFALTNSAKRSPSTFLSPTIMNDDEAEKRERQLSRVLEMQQRSIGTSPVTPAERRQSLSLGRLTNAQLAEHYADCIKLSTENKISAKNAFGLHLIDYIGELFKKKDVTDFQLASSTIDASAKIYAGRVDAIHSETYKVLTGLGRGAGHAQNKSEDENDDGEVVEGVNQPDEVNKKRKRARKSRTIETNLKAITLAKFDMDFEVDPSFQNTLAKFDDGGTAGLMLNQLRCLDDTCELVLDCNTVVTSAGNSSARKAGPQPVDIAELGDIVSASGFEKLEICPQFAQFEFGSWNLEEPSSMTFELPLSKKSDHVFDLDAEPEPIDEPVASSAADTIDDIFDCAEPDDDNDCGGGGVFPGRSSVENQAENMTSRLGNGIVNSLISILASEPSDYSYFRPDLLRTWAGPEHLRFQRRAKDLTATTGEKSTRKSKAKEPFTVTFDESLDLDSHFKQKRAAITVTAVTLEKHSHIKTTLPEDLHYNETQISQLFLMPTVTVGRQNVNSQLLEVSQYNYDNANDRCNFCPEAEAFEAMDNAPNDDSDGDDEAPEPLDFNLTSGDCSQAPASMSSTQASMAENVAGDVVLTGDNLIAPPRKIAKIDIDYARVAKKVDVKKLKQTMWDIITEHSKGEARLPEIGEPGTGFQELLDALGKRVSPTMAQNLSIPIAFVCLLHLANEKALEIRNVGEMMGDLCIAQDCSNTAGK